MPSRTPQPGWLCDSVAIVADWGTAAAVTSRAVIWDEQELEARVLVGVAALATVLVSARLLALDLKRSRALPLRRFGFQSVLNYDWFFARTAGIDGRAWIDALALRLGAMSVGWRCILVSIRRL